MSQCDTVGKPECVQHEFSGKLVRGHCGEGFRLGVGEVQARLAGFSASVNRLGLCRRLGGQLAVSTSTDTEVVAEGPVVDVVPALPVALRKGRHLVAAESGSRQARITVLLNVGESSVHRQNGWSPGKLGFSLECELIPADVFGFQCNCCAQIGPRSGAGLLGEAIHQVQIDVAESGITRFCVAADYLLGIVNSAKPLQLGIVERLRAQ